MQYGNYFVRVNDILHSFEIVRRRLVLLCGASTAGGEVARTLACEMISQLRTFTSGDVTQKPLLASCWQKSQLSFYP